MGFVGWFQCLWGSLLLSGYSACAVNIVLLVLVLSLVFDSFT